MQKDQIKHVIMCFVPLFLAFVAFFFFFGEQLLLTLKYTNAAGETVKEYISFNAFSLLKGDYHLSWLIISVFVTLFLGGALPVLSLINNDSVKKGAIFASIISLLVSVCLLFIMKEVFISYNAEAIANFKSTDVSWGLACSILFIMLAAGSTLFVNKGLFNLSTHAIAEDGVLIALAFVLNFVKVPLAATGGSVNLQLLPLFIIALRRGPLHGLVSSGVVYGLLTCLTDGYGLVTFPFDYLIGFGSAGFVGIFSKYVLDENKNFWARVGVLSGSVVVATFIRLVGGMASSMIVYEYGFMDSLIYNVPYVCLSGAAALVVLLALYYPLLKLNKIKPVEA